MLLKTTLFIFNVFPEMSRLLQKFTFNFIWVGSPVSVFENQSFPELPCDFQKWLIAYDKFSQALANDHC
jgi:hypothetical protein